MKYENDNKSVSFSNQKSNIKKKKELKIKLTKLTNSYFKPRREHFINNMRSLNFRILESSGGKQSIEKEVKESRNFRFGKTKDYFIHFTDLSPYKIEMAPFISSLKKQFTKEEINIIKKNKDYYIQSDFVKGNVPIFNDNSLYEILNNEEKEEEIEKKNVKVFHNLNYYDKRRKSVIFNLNNNNINISGNNSFSRNNKSNKKNKRNLIHFYQTSLLHNKDKNIEENKLTYNLGNLSHFYLKKNKLDIIEKDIRKKVNIMKKEDEKLNMIKEKKKNLLNDMTKESEVEIKKILGNNDYYNIGYYDMANEINLFKKRKKNKNKKADSSFPLINNSSSQTFFNIRNADKSKSIFLSYSNQMPKKTFSEIKDIKNRRQISLYKNEKMKELKKKNEENEQIILRDIHRKIKSIYDSFKYK